jgi:hypothetical protein
MSNQETLEPPHGGGSALNNGLCGWIDAELQHPELLEDKDYSKNVWGWDGKNILVVCFFVDFDGWYWANASGDVFGDPEFDDDYDIKYWQPILIPTPPSVITDDKLAKNAAVYFVLRIDEDPHARKALRAYAESVADENDALSSDLLMLTERYK